VSAPAAALVLSLLDAAAPAAAAAGAATSAAVAAVETSLGKPTASSIGFFFVIVVLTLVITWWAARRTRSAKEYYAAGRSVSGFQNGLALAGDYMSAASFLGIAGLVATKGYDGMIYATGWLVGWPALMFLVAEPLRNLGKYTFADVVAFRLKQTPVRIAAAIAGILTVLVYTTAQMVGRKLIADVRDPLSGGDHRGRDHDGLRALRRDDRHDVGADHQGGPAAGGCHGADGAGARAVRLQPLGALRRGRRAVFAGGARAGRTGHQSDRCGVARAGADAGAAGPAAHPDAVLHGPIRARLGAYAGFIGLYIIIPIVGFGASALVGLDLITKIDAGGNMAAPQLAEQLAGTPFLGFIAAVAFATILAVVAGLTLAGASALSHDIYTHVIKGGHATEADQVRVARWATVAFGAFAVVLGIVFKGQNVAYMVGLAFAIACANFPALFLSIVWRRFTTPGRGLDPHGSDLTVGLIAISPTCGSTS
jgi:cation/acetate symporter